MKLYLAEKKVFGPVCYTATSYRGVLRAGMEDMWRTQKKSVSPTHCLQQPVPTACSFHPTDLYFLAWLRGSPAIPGFSAQAPC